MKNIFWLPALLVICALTIGCKKDNCSNKIDAVQPNTNPAGYEVLIRTTGFTPAAKVVFGSVAATSRAGGEGGDIIAKVPAGLSGNVEISVEEGDCIKRSGGFVVSSGAPSGVQPSLPIIVVPTTPTTLPTTGGLQNNWKNAAEDTAGINLAINLVNGISQLDNSFEFHGVDTYFQNNPVTGNVNTNSNVIYLEVDRSAKGGSVEKFDGQFVPTPNSLLSKSKFNFVVFLISRETGRQLLLYFPKV